MTTMNYLGPAEGLDRDDAGQRVFRPPPQVSQVNFIGGVKIYLLNWEWGAK